MLTHKKPQAFTASPPEISQQFIADLLQATDIVRVVGASVQIKQSGSNFFGLCPFHGEKSPSFSVSQTKQIYHCFGCGMNGDAIKFLREYGGLSFPEAVAELAAAANMSMPKASAKAAPAVDLSGLLLTNERAASFFRHCLRHTPNAKNYLIERQIGSEALNRFLIGYAPEGWQSLEEAFKDYASSTSLVDLGLVIEKKNDDEPNQTQAQAGRRYDRFRDRIMFGIRDARGRIVGWGGRSLDGNLPKYLNSPQSALFEKSNQLFGLFEARDGIRQTKQVIVTEGFFDVVSNSMAGITQTVATMGTACTEQHIERLVALAPEVIFSFDGDKAGQEAAWKSLNTCLPFATDERTFRFLLLPAGMDPDEIIKTKGVDAYKALLGEAMTLSAFLLSHLSAENGNLQSAENKAKFLHDGLAILERLPKLGRLQGILRSELHKVCGMDPTGQIKTAVAATPPAPPLRPTSNPNGPWLALAQAVAAQQASAATRAEEMIAVLSQELQDAFFGSNFSAFSQAQQPFWRALDEAILKDEPIDQETSLCLAQRDLIARGPEFIRALLGKEAAAAARLAFRSGLTSEDVFLSGVQGLREQPPG